MNQSLSHRSAKITQNYSTAKKVNRASNDAFLDELQALADKNWPAAFYAARVVIDVFTRVLAIIDIRCDGIFALAIAAATPADGRNGEPVPVTFNMIAPHWPTKGSDESRRKRIGDKLDRLDLHQHRAGKALFTIERVPKEELGTGRPTRIADHITPLIRRELQAEFRLRTIGVGDGQATNAAIQAVAIRVANQLPEINPPGDETSKPERTPTEEAELINQSDRRTWERINALLDRGDGDSAIAAMNEADRESDFAQKQKAKILRRGSDILARLAAAAIEPPRCGPINKPEIAEDEADLSQRGGSPISDYPPHLTLLESTLTQDENLFPNELSYEASDEATWAEEHASYNATESHSELSPAPISNVPQAVRASVVPNETPDPAEASVNEERVRMAREALEAFRSVGQRNVGLRIGEKDDTKEWKVLPIEEAIRTAPEWLRKADEAQKSLAVRPTVADKFQTKMTPEEIAADDAAVYPRIIEPDLDKETALETYRRIHPLLFYGTSTSQNHYQGGVTVLCDKPTFMKLRRRFIEGVGSDPGASGSFRLPGSKNQKPGRQGNVIELLEVAHGLIWMPEDLEASGMLAPPEPEPEATPQAAREHLGFETWPSYAIAVDRAPLKQDGSPDLSSADLSFANIAKARGFSAAEVEVKLIEERSAYDQKATKNRGYVRRTVAKAFAG